MCIPDERVGRYESWLRDVTQIPTAAGREFRVVRWVEDWVSRRDGLEIRRDAHGNLEIRFGGESSDRPLYFTAHLDHPAFVVEAVRDPSSLELSFRGGVMDAYFENARVVVHCADDRRVTGRVGADRPGAEGPFPRYALELDRDDPGVGVGDVATWELPDAEVIDGVLHTNACDDLAAVSAALAAMEELSLVRAGGGSVGDVRVLLTLAEEIGFIGAIGVSRDGWMPRGSRVIALENSRSFEDSPIGGGPIVRVGDRVSVFSPDLTGAVARVAEEIAGGSAHVLAIEKDTDAPAWRWQRKLMAGGACEASVFCAFGYAATCVCLPLGNYHNMARLAEMQAGTHEGPAKVGREHISLADYRGMIELLVGCATMLDAVPSFSQRLEKLWGERAFVLG